ncbi:conserved hypothetical protein [Histoplasma capsulatum var. duboisii H88]|uniref:Cytochrome b561 domain-containing protein n=1 Tax=Ajellomyces capsulatus (strain H88) TaxID=544711 RepID=F0ULD5_AJEC8|nr:conserved hypothetical protein [Histoplasma capsulatum var. duboisii H88]QSS56826.1 hypothetical protein I7I53_05144 [Histoplasma capsulatum var. duboisii H88]
MSSFPQLAPPGSSTYSSNTLHVGDGTWDSQRNTFLLPNLMGLNFETMRYNGMGNRFREMAGYHSLIRAHGVIAAITFLCLIPTAILMARFYSPSPFWALRYHIWLHILSLFLSTVVFVLGWFAVGPERSLTNPHHGIGLAIYVLIIFQTLWGWFVHKRTKGKRLFHMPLKIMLHKWLGRVIALLGIAQIPLGLTLYGSPLALFVLYTLAVFTLVVIYFILTYLHERRMGVDYDSRGSYMSGPEVVEDGHGHSNFGRLATAGAAGAGLAMLGRRMRNRSRSRTSVDESDTTPRPHRDDEKSDHHHGGGGWGKRLFQIGALAGAAGLAKKYFDKRRERESDTESGRYEPAHGNGQGNTQHDSLYDDSSVQTAEARPRPSHPRPYDGPPSRPPSIGYTDSGYLEESERGHGVRNALLGAGAFAALRNIFKSRERREQDRVEELRRQDIENERRARQSTNHRKYTGDGQPPPSRRTAGRRNSFSTEMSESTDPHVAPPPGDVPPIPPIHHHHHHHRTASGSDTVTSIGGAGGDGKQPQRSSAASAATATANSGRRRRGRDQSVESEPVSINVKFHNDKGRRVTLRRLTPEEAAASRRAKKRDPHRSSHRRHGSVSSLSGHEGTDDHWRRVEERERMQQEQMDVAAAASSGGGGLGGGGASTAAPASTLGPPTPTPIRNYSGAPPPGGSIYSSPLPPPPHIPGATAPSSYLNSPPPGSTDLSSHASKRERRRAERRTMSRQGRHNVEFT